MDSEKSASKIIGLATILTFAAALLLLGFAFIRFGEDQPTEAEPAAKTEQPAQAPEMGNNLLEAKPYLEGLGIREGLAGNFSKLCWNKFIKREFVRLESREEVALRYADQNEIELVFVGVSDAMQGDDVSKMQEAAVALVLAQEGRSPVLIGHAGDRRQISYDGYAADASKRLSNLAGMETELPLEAARVGIDTLGFSFLRVLRKDPAYPMYYGEEWPMDLATAVQVLSGDLEVEIRGASEEDPAKLQALLNLEKVQFSISLMRAKILIVRALEFLKNRDQTRAILMVSPDMGDFVSETAKVYGLGIEVHYPGFPEDYLPPPVEMEVLNP